MLRHGGHPLWQNGTQTSPEREGIEPAAVVGHCVTGEPRVKPARSNLNPRIGVTMPRKHVQFIAPAMLIGAVWVFMTGAVQPAGADPGGQPATASSSHRTDGNAGTSGDVLEPQPPSNADTNGSGANTGPGPYTSTRNGDPSGNGNGNGLQTGEPCAGCVGKADNKNPPGQLPGPEDGDAGYECDTNHGIARTNPAHTGCVAPESQPPPCDAATTDCAPCVPSATTTCAPGGPPPPPPPGTEVLGETLTRNPVTVTEVSAQELARTGFPTERLVLIGAGAIAAGVVLYAFARRRRTVC